MQFYYTSEISATHISPHCGACCQCTLTAHTKMHQTHWRWSHGSVVRMCQSGEQMCFSEELTCSKIEKVSYTDKFTHVNLQWCVSGCFQCVGLHRKQRRVDGASVSPVMRLHEGRVQHHSLFTFLCECRVWNVSTIEWPEKSPAQRKTRCVDVKVHYIREFFSETSVCFSLQSKLCYMGSRGLANKETKLRTSDLSPSQSSWIIVVQVQTHLSKSTNSRYQKNWWISTNRNQEYIFFFFASSVLLCSLLHSKCSSYFWLLSKSSFKSLFFFGFSFARHSHSVCLALVIVKPG